jgi:hypothetical protein
MDMKRFSRASHVAPAFFLFLFCTAGLSGCVPAYERFTAANGKTYLASACANYYDCMQRVYDQCSGSFEILNDRVVPLLPSPSVAQEYAEGSRSSGHGNGRIVFSCIADPFPSAQAQLQHDIRELRAEIEEQEAENAARNGWWGHDTVLDRKGPL